MPKIGVSKSKLHAAFDEIQASGYLAEGKFTRRFEEKVSDWSGQHAAAVANCGSGLFAVLRQLRKRSGIAVVPVNTFFATGAMAKEAGFQVVGVDCSRSDFSLTAELLDKYAPGNTDVVVMTHVGGGLAHDYVKIAEWCRKRGVFLLEDAAHALGVGHYDAMHDVPAGTLGDAAVFSLYATKAVPIGEGGVVTSNDADLIDAVRTFCNYGKTIHDGVVQYAGVGFNLRMWEWAAAVGYLQMERLNELLELRAEAAEQLTRVCEPLVKWRSTNWYKFIVPGDFPAKKLAGKVYARTDQLTTALRVPGYFPNAEWVAENHKCLPIDEGLYAGMTTGDIEKFLGV